MSVRFAPSPTGTFHVGNFRTARISHAWAKRLGVPWVVRFEDIDRPRVVADAMERQTLEMASLGLHPDEVIIQSENFERHWSLFLQAVLAEQVYPCCCSRKEVREALDALASAPNGFGYKEPQYSGRCRSRSREEVAVSPLALAGPIAWRFRSSLSSGGEDFVVGRAEIRADGLPSRESFTPAYHWACAIDDWDGRYGLLVRAWDLEGAIENQRRIQAWLAGVEGIAAKFPSVFHCSLVTADDGSRLEKRTRGVTLRDLEAAGISALEVVRRLDRSFCLEEYDEGGAGGLQADRLFGERQRSRTLSSLGFHVDFH